ncbi:DUF7097 family protein [Halobellus ruber]|uniref:Uncharacterized protein n=1 Tax=Halobellus ruber TaxID=2761102 RepID=A0A7J9SKQ7_9EURY|nr:hypothetical protein [Halobellus ruber]MBB6647544.1 hypothetical protein [Halobellus ruber]
MQETPTGTPVGVDDPYDHAGVCDHLTDDGRCRFALTRAGDDPEFAAERRAADYDCVAAGDAEFHECPHYRSTSDGRECVRCGLESVRIAFDDSRPLLEEHHLSYGETGSEGGDSDGDTSHEITVALCRWCHAKIHNSFARIDDDAPPDPEAVAAREERRAKEHSEMSFTTARERRDDGAE